MQKYQSGCLSQAASGPYKGLFAFPRHFSHTLLYSLCYGLFTGLQRGDLAGKLCVFVQIFLHCLLRHCPASFLIGLPLFGGACPTAFIGAGCVRQALGGLRPSGVGGACAYAAIASGTAHCRVPVPLIIVYHYILVMSIDNITKY